MSNNKEPNKSEEAQPARKQSRKQAKKAARRGKTAGRDSSMKEEETARSACSGAEGGGKPDEPKDASKEQSSTKGGSRRHRTRGTNSKADKPHDPEQLAKYAWKIYLAEISEEGVTLIDDRVSKELARRCFELAKTFLDEQQRRD